MKLLRMTATFGRLEQETLSLTDGLNVLQMPNEAGKSTWAEFLLAMLYGVDTSEREKTGVLPVKTKYQPWSGKPMEGVIELEHAGRRITLTRTSTARAPLGVFSAVYTDSGLPVEGIAIIAGVDKIFDMGRTTLNITGDATCALFISRLEREKAARKAAKAAK